MIISHKHKLIFVKTKKTAGTSFEIALSNFTNQASIITPISKDDEKLRQKMGLLGPFYHLEKNRLAAFKQSPNNKFFSLNKMIKGDFLIISVPTKLLRI